MIARVRGWLGSITIRTKLTSLTAVLIAVIGGIIWLSTGSTSADHRRAVIDNIAGRQPMLVQRYVADVLLVKDGFTADPDATKDLLVHDADALLDGGAVLAVQGNDDEIHLSAQTDPTVRAKLTEFRRLVDELTAAGADVTRRDGSAWVGLRGCRLHHRRRLRRSSQLCLGDIAPRAGG